MAHPRKLIRQAVVALLATEVAAASGRVQGTRIAPHKKSQLPALSVYTLNDPVIEEESSEAEDLHELELEIAGWVSHSDMIPVDDAMDDLAEEIEAAMREAPYLGGAAGDVQLTGTTMEVVEDDARSSPIIGIVVLTYAVTYRSDLATTGALDDFLRVQAIHKLNGSLPSTVPAVDEFVVQEEIGGGEYEET